jgi:hypothetical protein
MKVEQEILQRLIRLEEREALLDKRVNDLGAVVFELTNGNGDKTMSTN